MSRQLILAAALLPSLLATPWIASVSPTRGSVSGGTEIVIEGDSFSPNKFTLQNNHDKNYGNWIYIRYRDHSFAFECEIEQTQSNTEKLVCITPDFSAIRRQKLPNNLSVVSNWLDNPFHKMQIFVVSDGEVSNYKEFSADDHWRTPRVYWVDNPYGYPDRVVSQHARLYTRKYNETMFNFGRPSECCQNGCTAMHFKNNDQICDIYDRSDPTNKNPPVHQYEIFGDGLAKRGSNRGKYKCKLGGNIVGYHNLTFHVTRGYGDSISQDMIMGTDRYPHDLMAYAVVTKIDKHETSTKGGAILEIEGNYFGVENPKENIVVKAGGKICEILQVSMTHIRCRLPEQEETPEIAPKIYYPGHRGIRTTAYRGQDQFSFEELENYNFGFAVNDRWGDTKDNRGPILGYNFEHHHIRPWHYKNQGYSAFSAFYFAPAEASRYKLMRGRFRDWHRNYKDDEGYENIMSLAIEDPSMPDGSTMVNPEEPYLLKTRYAEPGDDGKTYPSYWISYFKVRDYLPKMSDFKRDLWMTTGMHSGRNSVKTVHQYNISASFQNEIQKLSFIGDKSKFTNIGLKIGDMISTQPITNWNNPKQLVNGILSTQGNLCPTDYFPSDPDEPYYFQDFENIDSCVEDIFPRGDSIVTDSFCGRKSLKISTLGRNWFNLFKADESKNDCTVNKGLSGYSWDRQNNLKYRYICFSYKGNLKDVHGANKRSYVAHKLSYFDKHGDYKVIDDLWGAWWEPLDIADETLDQWKWQCVDMNRAITHTMNWLNNRNHTAGDKDPAKGGGGATGHRLMNVKLRLDDKLAGYVYVDNIFVSNDYSKAKKETLELIQKATGPVIKDMSYTSSGDQHTLEMVPGECTTGHGLVEFLELDQSETNEDKLFAKENNGKWTYRRNSWASGTYLQVERLEKSKSRLTDTIMLDYDRLDKPVKLDISSSSAIDFVNAYASAGFATSIAFIEEPTCEALKFNVTFDRPGGAHQLPKISNYNKNEVTITSELMDEGYDEYLTDMSWFISAHKLPQVQVIVNKMYSHCSGNCDLIFTSELDPEILLSEGDFDALIPGESILKFTGKNIDNLKIDGLLVDLIDSTFNNATNITTVEMRVNEKQGSGIFDIILFDQHNGKADYPLQVTVTYDLQTITPDTISVGGGSFQMIGTGLSCDMEIQVGQVKCVVDQENCDYQHLKVDCDLSKNASPVTGDTDVLIDGSVAGTIEIINGYKLVQIRDANEDYYVQNYNTGVISKDEIYLMFDGGVRPSRAQLSVQLFSNTRTIKNIDIIEIDSAYIHIQLPILQPDVYKFKIQIGTILMYSSITITSDFTLLSLSRNVGSMYGGGDKLVIQGSGFENDGSDNVLSVKVGENHCENLEIMSSTEVQCDVPSNAKNHQIDLKLNEDNKVAWPPLIKIYEGDTITWTWDVNNHIFNLKAYVCETDSPGAVICKDGGFISDPSKNKSKQGVFQKKFNKVETIYVSSGCVDRYCTIFTFSTISVEARPKELQAEVSISYEINDLFDIKFAKQNINHINDASLNLAHDADTYQIHQTNQNNKFFNYKMASTGEVTLADWKETGHKISSTLSFRGKNFNGMNWKVFLIDPDTLDKFPCVITDIKSYRINCLMDTTNFEPTVYKNLKYEIYNDLGQAGILPKNIWEEYVALKPVVNSIITENQGSYFGGSQFEIGGFGLDLAEIEVEFDHSGLCEKVSSSYTKITCITPPFEANSVTKIDFNKLRDKHVEMFVKYQEVYEVDNLLSRADNRFIYKINKTPVVESISLGNQPGEYARYLDKISDYAADSTDPNSGNLYSDPIIMAKYDKIIPEVTVGGDAVTMPTVYLNDISLLGAQPRLEQTLPGGDLTLRITDDTYGNAWIASDFNYNFAAPTSLTEVNPSKGSVLGGQVITVLGSGFDAESKVLVGSNECKILELDSEFIKCVVPACDSCQAEIANGNLHIQATITITEKFENQQLTYTYCDSYTPRITRLSTDQGLGGDEITLYGENLGNNRFGHYVYFDGITCAVQTVASTQMTCILGEKEGGEIDLIELFIDEYGIGEVNSDIKFKYILAINDINLKKISPAGAVTIEVYGHGFNDNVELLLCDEVIEYQFVNSETLRFIAPPSNDEFTNKICEVKVIAADGDSEDTYRYLRYDESLMPRMLTVSPDNGGTSGGTKITITGSGFFSMQNPEIYISIAKCEDLQILTDGELTCWTTRVETPIPDTLKKSKIRLESSLGQAKNENNLEFWYIDTWNSRFTWGGQHPPAEGDMVVIDKGQTVMIDGQTEKVKMLLINGGHVIFDESQDAHLRAENILVHKGGSITAGTLDQPYTGNLKIEMFGTPGDIELPVYGAKTLAVREGTVSLNGLKKIPTWTTLANHAEAGSEYLEINVTADFNWQVGDEIVIVSTGAKGSTQENEVRSIVEITDSNGNKSLKLNKAIDFRHLGEIVTLPNGKTLDMRAEVGVLTRNIVFTGDETSVDTQFGGAIMVGPTKPGTVDEPSQGHMQLSNIQVTKAGQISRLARYPVHNHFLGYTEDSYIQDIVVWNSFNRAIVVHHTHNLHVDNSVIFEVLGGAMFIEDGIERDNKITNNLVAGVKASTSLQLDDITPAAIWVTNPANVVENNRVGGCEAFGIWYRMFKHPEAGSFTTDICQQHEPMGTCKNNVVHSVGMIGIWVFETYAPYEGSGYRDSCLKEVPKAAVWANNQVYRANKCLEFFDAGALQIHDSVFAECSHAGVEWKRLLNVGWDNVEKGAYMTGVTIAARTPHYNDTNVQGRIREETGLIVPAQSGLLVNDVTFIDYGQVSWSGNKSPETEPKFKSAAIGGPRVQCIHSTGNGAFETRFQNTKWVNTDVKARSRWGNDLKIVDLDGTFTGDGQKAVLYSRPADDPEDFQSADQNCEVIANDDENYLAGFMKCKNSAADYNHLRILKAQEKALHHSTMNFTVNGKTRSVKWQSEGVNEEKRGWNLLVPNAVEVEIDMKNAIDYKEFGFIISLLDMKVGSWNILKFNNVAEKPDEIKLDNKAAIEESLTALNQNSAHNTWNYKSKTLSIMVKNDGTRPWAEKPKIHSQGLLDSVGENQEGIRPIIYPASWRSCGGPCNTPPPPTEAPIRLDIPDDRPKWAIFTSKMDFGKERKKIATDDYDFGWYTVAEKDGKAVIKSGENIYVPEGVWLVIDTTLPQLNNIIIKGTLEISEACPELKVANILVFGGKLTIKGTKRHRRSAPLKLIFTGDKYDKNAEDIGFGPDDYFGHKGLLCYGECDLGANSFTGEGFSVLEADVKPGDKEVTTHAGYQTKDWPAGKKVRFASTSMDSTQVEELEIEESKDNTIKFKTGFQYFHRGTADNDFASMKGELMFPERKIEFIGEASPDHAFGFRILVGDIFLEQGIDNDGQPEKYEGSAYMYNIKFTNAGQWGLNQLHLPDNPTWGVIFKDTTKRSEVTRCNFEDNYAPSVGIINSFVVLHKNTFYKPIHAAAQAYKSPKAVIEYSLVMNFINAGNFVYDTWGQKPSISLKDRYMPAAIRADHVDSRVRYNRVANAVGVGIVHRGNRCGDNDWRSKHNKVRGAQFGYMFEGKPEDKCEKITSLDISHSYYVGMLIVIGSLKNWPAGRLYVDDCRVANSRVVNTYQLILKNMGDNLDASSFTNNEVKIKYRRNRLYGMTDTFVCDQDHDGAHKDMKNYIFGNKEYFPRKIFPTSFSGDLIASSGSMEDIPGWHSIWAYMNFNWLREHVIFEDTHFVNMGGTDHVCDKSLPSYLIANFQTDAQMADMVPIFTNRITKTNVNEKYLTKFMKPHSHNAVKMKCIDMDCNAFTTLLISDWDGSFVGTSGGGAILPNPEYIWGVENVNQKLNYERIPVVGRLDADNNPIDYTQHMPFKGRAKKPGSCNFSTEMNAHVCSGGYRYNIITLSNHDHDVNQRRIGPLSVIINRGPEGTADIYNSPPRDGGSLWGKSTGFYKTTVPLGQTGEFYFQATPPQKMRIQMEGGDWSDGRRHQSHRFLMKIYNPIPQMLKVASMDARVQELPTTKTNLKMHDKRPTIKNSPGTYFHDREEQMLYLVVSDDRVQYEVTVSDQIMMSFGIPPVKLEDFFEDQLVQNVAGFLGVPQDKIKYMLVISERTVLKNRKRRETEAETTEAETEVIKEVVGVKIEISLDDETEEGEPVLDAAVVEQVHEKNNQLLTETQLGDTSKADSLLAGVNKAAPEETLKVESVAIITTPKTVEAQEAFVAKSDAILEQEQATGQKVDEIEELFKASEVKFVNELRLETSALEVDCSKGGSEVAVPTFDLNFYDNLGAQITITNDWKIDLQVDADHEEFVTGDLSKTVVNTGVSFDNVKVNCDAYKHAESEIVMSIPAQVKVSGQDESPFEDLLTVTIKPQVIASVEITTKPQTIDCGLGSVMSLEDLVLKFKNPENTEVYVGSEFNPLEVKLEITTNNPNGLASDFLGQFNITAENDAVIFSNLKVNCDNFRYNDQQDTEVYMKVFFEDPKFAGWTQTYGMRLLSENIVTTPVPTARVEQTQAPTVPATTTTPEPVTMPPTTASTLAETVAAVTEALTSARPSGVAADETPIELEATVQNYVTNMFKKYDNANNCMQDFTLKVPKGETQMLEKCPENGNIQAEYMVNPETGATYWVYKKVNNNP